ncbi:cyclic-phosphate processing receiver domain-containing protein [Paludisphaera sp.]|uniref:cyclic-phosphate processing receiver domain-containing protein n=1 Tax=Paludisphaera sp. TaxID=2017432 RepID=UPI00301D0143
MIESPGAGPTPPASRRVLFLDDDPRRAELFLECCPHAVWVTDVGACVDRLAEPWDEVHLDHDLNGERFVDESRDDCGMAVVRWLCSPSREHLRRARFFVHSHNSAAASRMVLLLLRHGYMAEYRPFGHDLVDFLTLGPPPRGRGLFRGLGAIWGRVADRWARLTRRTASRYDGGDSRGRGPRAGRKTTSEEGP